MHLRDASDGDLDRKTSKGGRSRHAQEIPIVRSGFRLFYFYILGAKAAFHRALKGGAAIGVGRRPADA
ncbi:hypothetical protein, partial [Devosia sp.]|uniref:hypothetical protein n=1 Tax=Devosia sp. TaxID=1871048 RepID=UPI00339756D2